MARSGAADVVAVAVDHDALDAGSGAGSPDAEHQPVAVDEDAGVAGTADLCDGEGVADGSGHVAGWSWDGAIVYCRTHADSPRIGLISA